MNNIFNTIASQLSDKGIVLKYKENSIFQAINGIEDLNIITSKVGDKILNDISIVKHRYIPFYTSLVNMVQSEINNSNDMSELSKYSIDMFKINPVITAFQKANRFSNDEEKLPLLPSNRNYAFMLPGVEDIKRVFAYKGDVELEKQADELVKDYSEAELTKVFEKYLVNISISNLHYSNMVNNDSYTLEELFLLFLGLKYYRDNKPIYYKDVADLTYMSDLDLYIKYVGIIINLQLSRAQYAIEKKRLIKNIDGYNVVVYAPVYEEFLSMGNSPDVILGSAIEYRTKGDTDFMLSDIVEDKEELLQVWENEVNLIRLSNSRNIGNKYKVYFSICLRKLLTEELPENILGEFEIIPNEVQGQVDKYLNTVSEADIVKIDRVAAIIMGDFVFKGTIFTDFTTEMFKCQDEIPNITPKAAASYATIKYVLKYYLDQIEVANVG